MMTMAHYFLQWSADYVPSSWWSSFLSLDPQYHVHHNHHQNCPSLALAIPPLNGTGQTSPFCDWLCQEASSVWAWTLCQSFLLDTDTLVVKNVDDLLQLPAPTALVRGHVVPRQEEKLSEYLEITAQAGQLCIQTGTVLTACNRFSKAITFRLMKFQFVSMNKRSCFHHNGDPYMSERCFGICTAIRRRLFFGRNREPTGQDFV